MIAIVTIPKMMCFRTVTLRLFSAIFWWLHWWIPSDWYISAASFAASEETRWINTNGGRLEETCQIQLMCQTSQQLWQFGIWQFTYIRVWWCLMFIIVNCNDRSLTQNTRIILRDRKSVSSHQVIVASTSHEQLCVATWSYLEMHVHRYNKGRHSWMSPLVSGWETWLKPSQVDGFSCINASFQSQSLNAKFNFQVRIGQSNWLQHGDSIIQSQHFLGWATAALVGLGGALLLIAAGCAACFTLPRPAEQLRAQLWRLWLQYGLLMSTKSSWYGLPKQQPWFQLQTTWMSIDSSEFQWQVRCSTALITGDLWVGKASHLDSRWCQAETAMVLSQTWKKIGHDAVEWHDFP